MKPCSHEGAKDCSYIRLRKEKSKDIAKRLSEYVDQQYINATEDALRYSEEFWEDEGLLYEFHGSFTERIAMMSRDMRIGAEIEMIPILTQRYFLWLKEHKLDGYRGSHADNYLNVCIMDIGINLHRKTMRLLSESIIEAGKLVTIYDVVNKEELDQKIKEFVMGNPRQRSITGTRKMYTGSFDKGDQMLLRFGMFELLDDKFQEAMIPDDE